MKFTKIRLLGPSAVDLPIIGATPDGPFVLQDAEGFGPPDVDVSMIRTRTGTKYSGRSPQNREVSVTVGLQPSWIDGQSSDDLRKILYSLLTPKYGLMLRVQLIDDEDDGVVVAETTGHVRRMEPLIFSKDPSVKIYIPTMSPYLSAPNVVYTEPSRTVDSGFTYLTFQNEGDAPSGFVMAINFPDGHTGTLQISDDYPFGESFDVNHEFAAGTGFSVNTIMDNRGAYKITLAKAYNPILGDVTADSDWFQLHGGENVIKINNDNVQFEVIGFGYTPQYWGI